MLVDLPSSLQHMILLEWLLPRAVCAVARANGVLRRTVLSAPHPFSAHDTIVVDTCVRWFHERGVPLRLWEHVIIGKTGYVTHIRNGKFHRQGDLPALTTSNGTRWWVTDAEAYRADRFSYIVDCPETGERYRRWIELVPVYIVFGNGNRAWRLGRRLHRENDLPAYITPNGTQEWHWYGHLHREDDKPAIVVLNGTQKWYRHGELHRDGDRPAVIMANGTRKWYQLGELHRDGDQPAVIRADGTRLWYQHGVERSAHAMQTRSRLRQQQQQQHQDHQG